MYTSFNNNYDSLFKTYLICLKHILWCLLINLQNWNIWKVFFSSPIINKKDWHANFWIKRFSVLSFFACAQVTLNRKSIWHGHTLQGKRGKLLEATTLFSAAFFLDIPEPAKMFILMSQKKDINTFLQ